MSGAEITRSVVAKLLAARACPPIRLPWGGICTDLSGPVTVHLHWHPGDPLAVRMEFGSRQDPTNWFPSRELLATGLLMPVGDGDVHVEPHDNGLAVCLNNGRQQAWLVFGTSDMAEFLEATYRQVPLGREHVDLDGLEQAIRGAS